MFDYTKLEDQIEEKRARAKYICDKAVADTREMDPTERKEYDTLYGEISATRSLVDQMKDNELDELRDLIKSETPKASRSDRDFNQELRSMPHNGNMEIRAWLTSSAASATVAEEWHNQVMSIAFEESVARKSGMQSFATQTTHNIPYLSAYGSGMAVIATEGAAYTADDPTISEVQFGAFKFVKRIDVSEELLADTSYDLPSLLARAAGVAFGRAEDRNFISSGGSGNACPSGIFSTSATTSGASATPGPNAAELIAFLYTLPRHYRDGACWYMSDTMTGHIAALRATASAVETRFWYESGRVGEPATLLGKPVYTCSDINASMSSGVKQIALANPKYYMIGDRGGFNVKRLQLSEHSDTFAMSKRMDGHPLTSSAIRIYVGGSG